MSLKDKKKPKISEVEYFTAIQINHVSTVNKKVMAEILKSIADWIAASGNNRARITFVLEFSK